MPADPVPPAAIEAAARAMPFAEWAAEVEAARWDTHWFPDQDVRAELSRRLGGEFPFRMYEKRELLSLFQRAAGPPTDQKGTTDA